MAREKGARSRRDNGLDPWEIACLPRKLLLGKQAITASQNRQQRLLGVSGTTRQRERELDRVVGREAAGLIAIHEHEVKRPAWCESGASGSSGRGRSRVASRGTGCNGAALGGRLWHVADLREREGQQRATGADSSVTAGSAVGKRDL